MKRFSRKTYLYPYVFLFILLIIINRLFVYTIFKRKNYFNSDLHLFDIERGRNNR